MLPSQSSRLAALPQQELHQHTRPVNKDDGNQQVPDCSRGLCTGVQGSVFRRQSARRERCRQLAEQRTQVEDLQMSTSAQVGNQVSQSTNASLHQDREPVEPRDFLVIEANGLVKLVLGSNVNAIVFLVLGERVVRIAIQPTFTWFCGCDHRMTTRMSVF